MNRERRKGQYLTIECKAYNDDGSEKDISSGYRFTASVKKKKSDSDATAYVHVDSTSDPTRFATSGGSNKLVAQVLSSVESNGADLRVYFYDLWMKDTTSGEEELIEEGTIKIVDSVTDTK